ncbi:MAG: efflux RND transporter periplasmic adaptor subunit [Ignavibacteria bacterium]
MAVAEAALVALLNLSRRARQASDTSVLAFLAVNDSHALAPYRQAALWTADAGVRAASGVVQLEANAPYVHWLDAVCRHAASGGGARPLGAEELPAQLAAEWSAWLPAFGLWLPLTDATENSSAAPWGGLLLARETPWQDAEIALLCEWMDVWRHAWQSRIGHAAPPWWRNWRSLLRDSGQPWWKQRRVRLGVAVFAVLLAPVRLTVLAPGELVPANPTVIRAPMEGVVGSFHVKPNQAVKAGQPLFDFDDAPLKSKLEVARQSLTSAEAEYRQAAQLAVSDAKYKGQPALLTGKVEERRAEATYMQGQMERAHVVAPHDGIVLFDDPSEWIGKPVNTGERIMRVAAPDDVEVEAWLALGDAIPLEPGAPVSLYLNASPLSAVSAHIRYVAYESVPRPEGNFAYRVRATLDGKTDQRVGLKGTAKLSGRWVPVAYWITRKPLAAVRQLIGW